MVLAVAFIVYLGAYVRKTRAKPPRVGASRLGLFPLNEKEENSFKGKAENEQIMWIGGSLGKYY